LLSSTIDSIYFPILESSLILRNETMAGFLDTKLYSPTLPILLRNPEPRDAPALSKLFSDPRNTQHDVATSITPEQALTTITRFRESAAAAVPTRVNLVVVLLPAVNSPDEVEVVGISGFGGIDEFEREVEGEKKKVRFADVGVMLNEEWRGKGFAAESVRLSVDFAFEKLKTEGVSCQMLEVNEAMVGLVDKKFGWRRVDSKKGEVRFEVEPEEWRVWNERRSL